MRFAALCCPLLLVSCSLPGGFPSLSPRPAETPRTLEVPDAGIWAVLSPEERQGLAADLARERLLLAATRQGIEQEAAAFRRLVARPEAGQGGSAAWSEAQMQASRLEAARLPLDDIRARLSPSLLLVDSLDAANPDRRAVAALLAEVVALSLSSRKQLDDGLRALGDETPPTSQGGEAAASSNGSNSSAAPLMQ